MMCVEPITVKLRQRLTSPLLQEEQLQSSEALVADFQHCLQIKDSEFETLKRKVRCLYRAYNWEQNSLCIQESLQRSCVAASNCFACKCTCTHVCDTKVNLRTNLNTSLIMVCNTNLNTILLPSIWCIIL